MSALQDFRVVAIGAGADQLTALATYSVRGYEHADDLVAMIEDRLGIEVEIIDGQREAELAFMGAIHSVDVNDGVLIDLGGGSLEIAHFRDRQLLQTWSLPLGALLLSDRFLNHETPSSSEADDIQMHVEKVLHEAGIRPLRKDEHLVATGGTVRNVAKIDQAEHRYAIPQIHGYALTRRRLKAMVGHLTGVTRDGLSAIPRPQS